ncbi:unnamed protein product [Hymenolepis diminuta]|uniref:DM domain-containing protein n=1 Tax=Hymenolepis diminuta TaxID=6216 RepID=A0A564YVG9_HYMDI|nr:unnamed protein product [Hymenolepis diminuta]
MVGLYPNGNNQIPDTPRQDIQRHMPLMDPSISGGGGGDGGVSSTNNNVTNDVSNPQATAPTQAYSAGLDEFSHLPATDYCGRISNADIFQPTDYASYHQAVGFRPFEGVGEMPVENRCCYPTSDSELVSSNQNDRLGNLFRSAGFQNMELKSSSPPQNIVCGQEDMQKSFPSLPLNPIYPNLCLSTTQRLPFDSDPQQITQPVPIIQDLANQQQSLCTFQSSTNKFRSQSGLMELLGTRTVKSSANPISPKSETEMKPQKCDENGASAMVDNNAVPRSSYMCRKCRAHGRLIAVRQHKRNCPYKHCSCSVCSLVNYGRHIVARQIALYRDQKNHHIDESGNLGRGTRGDKSRGSDKIDIEDEGPHCRRCRNHGKTNPWKGHKKVCPFYYCICQQCILITLRKSNEKNLREVVQESYKEMGLKTTKKQQTSENVNFPTQFYNKKTTKSAQEKQVLNQEQELPSAYQDSYGLRWRNQEESGKESAENDAGFLQANIQQQNDFYDTRAHHAAAFAAAAAAAVAFQQENAVSSIDSALPLKEESHIDCGAQQMGQTGYPLQDNWIFGNEVKCALSPKDINPTQMEGFPGHNGFSTFWQSGPLQPTRSEEQMRADSMSLSNFHETPRHLEPNGESNPMIGGHGQLLPNKVGNIS